MGIYPYGNILRTTHNLQSVKKRRLDAHVANFLVDDIQNDALLDSGAAWEYLSRLHSGGSSRLSEDHLPSAYLSGDIADASTVVSGRSKLRREFIRLIYWQKGPFSKVGTNRVPVVLFGIT